MGMTREEVLAEMEADFAQMTDEEKNGVLFRDADKDWTPALLIEEVRNATEYGVKYAESWSLNKEQNSLLDGLLAALLGDGMTCGDPDCPNCHGEVRPFGALPGTGTDGKDPTIH